MNKKQIKQLKNIIKEIVKVENMQSSRGNDIVNQFIVYGNDWELFQSYSSPIALKKGGKVYLFKDWEYSTTTAKYRNQFLSEDKKETMKKLKSGEYIAVDFEVC